MAIWDPYLSEAERRLIADAGYAQRMGWGARPALIVIDVNYNFTGDKPLPVTESIVAWPNSCGVVGWDALPQINRLLSACHARNVPVFFATDDFRSDGWNIGSWMWKTNRITEDAPSARSRVVDGSAIHDSLKRRPSDVIIRKLKPSAFNGTALRQLLNLLGVDTLVVCGTTTSGCVRSTAVDAFSDNLRVIVPEEACFDRLPTSHAISLFDLNAKYADVLGVEEVVEHIEQLPDDLFRLPGTR
jgi:nicotinamidase-related amidase